jgi:hypothetical protein
MAWLNGVPAWLQALEQKVKGDNMKVFNNGYHVQTSIKDVCFSCSQCGKQHDRMYHTVIWINTDLNEYFCTLSCRDRYLHENNIAKDS